MSKRTPAPTALHRAEYKRNIYFDIADQGVTLADVMHSDYWVHVVKQFRANDVVEVMAADASFDVAFRITSITADGKMTFRLLREAPIKLNAAFMAQFPPAPSSGRFEVKRAFQGKYNVIDTLTGEVVASGLGKEAADSEALALNAPAKAA
jgi:hypothetical protein